jgi:hypothetical protein
VDSPVGLEIGSSSNGAPVLVKIQGQ